MIKTDWLSLLFDPGDSLCLSETSRGTAVIDRMKLEEWPQIAAEQFVCINALDGERDRDPIAEYHSADRPRRADANVTKFRTILVEFDGIPLVEQAQLVAELAMPYTLATYSGRKSIHYLIVLEEPLASRQEYDALVNRVYKALGGPEAGLDTSTKNPSRFTRTPNAVRDGGRVQDLLETRSRVRLEELEAWLKSQGFSFTEYLNDQAGIAGSRYKEKPKTQGMPNWKAPLSPATQYFLMFEAPEGEWNTACFKATCDMVRSGYTEDEILTKMEKAFGYLEFSAVNTIKSAVRRALADDPK